MGTVFHTPRGKVRLKILDIVLLGPPLLRYRLRPPGRPGGLLFARLTAVLTAVCPRWASGTAYCSCRTASSASSNRIEGKARKRTSARGCRRNYWRGRGFHPAAVPLTPGVNGEARECSRASPSSLAIILARVGQHIHFRTIFTNARLERWLVSEQSRPGHCIGAQAWSWSGL